MRVYLIYKLINTVNMMSLASFVCELTGDYTNVYNYITHCLLNYICLELHRMPAYRRAALLVIMDQDPGSYCMHPYRYIIY